MRSMPRAANCGDALGRRRSSEWRQDKETRRQGDRENRNQRFSLSPPLLVSLSFLRRSRRSHGELIEADLLHWRVDKEAIDDLANPHAELRQIRLSKLFTCAAANRRKRFVPYPEF